MATTADKETQMAKTLVKRTIITETFEDPDDLELDEPDEDEEAEEVEEEEEEKPAPSRRGKK